MVQMLCKFFEEVGDIFKQIVVEIGGIDCGKCGVWGVICIWLMMMFVFVMVMIVVGGLICFIDSGLLIMEWDLIFGVIFFMSVEVWDVEFVKYQII